MKSFHRAMALFLCLSLCCALALADYVSVETPVFSDRLECIATLQEDEEYQLGGAFRAGVAGGRRLAENL